MLVGPCLTDCLKWASRPTPSSFHGPTLHASARKPIRDIADLSVLLYQYLVCTPSPLPHPHHRARLLGCTTHNHG